MSSSFAFVNTVAAQANPSSTTITLPDLNTTTGNLVVVGIRFEGGGVSDTATISVSDTASNTYTVLGYNVNTSGSEDERIGLAYVLSASGHATNSITITISSSRSYRDAVAAQYSYSGTIAVGDTGSGNAPSTSQTTAFTTSPGLSAVADDLVVGWFGHYNSLTTTADSGYTKRGGTYAALIDQIPASGGSYSPSVTASTADSYVALTAVFEAAGGGGGGASLVRTRLQTVPYRHILTR